MAGKSAPVVVNLDTIMMELGQFGKFQLRNYLLIALPVIFAACNNGNYIFSAADLDYRCFIPECDLNIHNATLETDWLSNAMPLSTNPRRCTWYAPMNVSNHLDPGGNEICPSNMFDPNNVISCDQWVFSESKSIVKELGIQCQFWKRTLVGTVHSFGLLFALPIVAIVSDRYGRKVAFVLSAFFAGVFGICRSFSNSYLMFLVFEFIEPLLGSGVYSSGFILGMELVGPKRRVLGGTILSMFYSTGGILLGSIAWLVPYWRHLLLVLYAPSVLFIFYFFIINESVRWLISKGQYRKAVEILKKAAKVNGVTLTEKSMENLYSNVEIKNELKNRNAINDEDKEKEVKVSLVRQVFRSPIILRRVMKCSFWWITCTLVYYGLSINSVSLAGNIYLNYIFVSLVELPAYLMGYYLLDKIGRKYTLCSSFIISGIACIAFPFLPLDLPWLSLIMYLLGKFFITMSFGSCYIYTSELFPTPLRHSLMGTCSMIGRIGSIIAPQTPLLAEYMASLPSLLFGSCAIISGILMLSSPETLNIKLPDTIEEAENLSKSIKIKVQELQRA